MRAAFLFILAILPACVVSAANSVPSDPERQASMGSYADPSWQHMQRAVLFDRDAKEVEAYLKAGFNVQSPIGCGTFDSLDGAVSVQDPEMVDLLLRYGARPKESTFVEAAFLSNFNAAIRIVTAFLRAGADVNSKMRYSENPAMYWTALDQAVWRQNIDLVRLLLSQKGISVNDIDGDGRTALEIAIGKGNSTLGELLLQAGADPHVTGVRRHTALAARADPRSAPLNFASKSSQHGSE
jgi:Ankyrin repeats (3 copies)